MLVAKPPEECTFDASSAIIIGNTALYGATSGSAYFQGVAAERFAVRNSGARGVVVGVGNHGCEYMTGGRVVILGNVGRNFGAGMSGGIAYIFDPQNDFDMVPSALNKRERYPKCNSETVTITDVEIGSDSEVELKMMIKEHIEQTNSAKAKDILNDWAHTVKAFRLIIGTEYKAIMDQAALEKNTVGVKPKAKSGIGAKSSVPKSKGGNIVSAASKVLPLVVPIVGRTEDIEDITAAAC
jgi:glutamate synthase domain-containing protein 3